MELKREQPKMDLKQLRIAHGWSQNEAANRIGFSRNYLAMVENGKQYISKNMMKAVIDVYGVTYDDFYKDI